jgi:hypothetical protein
VSLPEARSKSFIDGWFARAGCVGKPLAGCGYELMVVKTMPNANWQLPLARG